jgi:ABC-type multidrug transport system ATPase subunit
VSTIWTWPCPKGDLWLSGPNGAGKTTSLKMILGLVWPTAGEAQVFAAP